VSAISYWGQPPGDYEPMPGTVFVQSRSIPLRHRSGFKIHVTVDSADCEQLARLILPTLRLLHLHHKIVESAARYFRLNQGRQQGKFITIYPGPASFARRVEESLDPLLVGRFRPGPAPGTRQSGHAEREIAVGRSGLIFCHWSDDYFR
jgi:hypothetical protein